MIRRCDLETEYNFFKSDILKAIENVLKSGEYILGQNVIDFEKSFSNYIGANHSIGVANATQGLTMGLRALGVQKGDEVITSPFTSVPTLSSILLAGATPIFVDIDPDTYLMNIQQIKNKITKKTKAIMPVHIFGNVVDIQKIKDVINDISIIEDASQAHGSKIDNLHAGSIGNLSVFSFYPTKNLGCYGDGGMISTSDNKIYKKLLLTRNYGLKDKDTMLTVGENSRLDEIQASILKIKLNSLDLMNKKRSNIIDFYVNNLPEEIIFQKHNKNVQGNYHVAAARVLKNRNKMLEFLNKSKIQTNIYYTKPLFEQPALSFLKYDKNNYPEANQLCNEVFALPIYPEMPNNYLDIIKNSLENFFS